MKTSLKHYTPNVKYCTYMYFFTRIVQHGISDYPCRTSIKAVVCQLNKKVGSCVLKASASVDWYPWSIPLLDIWISKYLVDIPIKIRWTLNQYLINNYWSIVGQVLTDSCIDRKLVDYWPGFWTRVNGDVNRVLINNNNNNKNHFILHNT